MSHYGGYVDQNYLDASARVLDHVKTRSWSLLGIGVGSSVLDVGCGPGIDTVELGAVVGPTGRVVGVDLDPAMIDAARSRAEESGRSEWVSHKAAPADSLPFDDGTFDASRSERMLQHLDDPGSAVAELARVTRPGGRVVIVDTDWASLSIDTDLLDIERRLVRHKGETLTRRGTAGRELYRLLRAAELTEVTVEPVALYASFDLFRVVSMWDDLVTSAVDTGVVTADEAAAIEADLDDRDRHGWSYGTLTVAIAAGTRS